MTMGYRPPSRGVSPGKGHSLPLKPVRRAAPIGTVEATPPSPEPVAGQQVRVAQPLYTQFDMFAEDGLGFAPGHRYTAREGQRR